MGAEWADSLGADVISSSVGYFEFNDPFPDYRYADMDGHTTDVTRAAEIAASKGILVVNAVGNEGNTSWRHLIAPADANGDSMLSVGAIDLLGDTTSFSSAGPSADGRTKPDVVARGLSNPIVSTSGNPSAYSTNSGTSFAAPLVAGLMACLIEARPDLTPVELIAAVKSTASRAGTPDQKMGYGIPNALSALHRTIDPGRAASGRFFRIGLEGANPTREGVVRVSFDLADGDAEPLDARLHVVDLLGRSLRTLWSGRLCYGQRGSAEWDGKRGDGSRAGPGVYWLALEGAGHLERVRVVALR
jgi:subtilisin family serine protease